MSVETIRYLYTLPDGSTERFELDMDTDTLLLVGNVPEHLPGWARLDYHQCRHCPLKPAEYTHCPVAANIAGIVNRFDHLHSYDELQVEVQLPEKRVCGETSAQRGIGSMLGFVIATSGCPHTAFFRPMARFHLPLSSRDETVYRAASMYLMAQYFLGKEGHTVDLALEGLQEIYRNVQVVNAALLDRLRSFTRSDSSVNAILILDLYAKNFQFVIKDSLEQIRYLFEPYFPQRRHT